MRAMACRFRGVSETDKTVDPVEARLLGGSLSFDEGQTDAKPVAIDRDSCMAIRLQAWNRGRPGGRGALLDLMALPGMASSGKRLDKGEFGCNETGGNDEIMRF